MKKLLHRFFATRPNSPMADLGLLVLRAWLGVAIVCNHGWGKLSHFEEMADKFGDPLHLGTHASLALATFAEFFCGLLLALGLLSRFAALVLCINLAVAFTAVHQLSLSGPHSGELAFVYLAGFVALLIAGPGKYSIDSSLFKS